MERGGEPPNSVREQETFPQAVRSDCVDTVLAETGHVMIQGNCLGGATTINGAVWTEETFDWIQETMVDMTGVDSFFDEPTIAAANTWVRDRMAPNPSSEQAGTFLETYTTDLANAFDARPEFSFVPSNLDGQPANPDAGIFRTHSLFDFDGSNQRRSAEQILDRSIVDVVLNADVRRLTYQGDFLGTPFSVTEPATTPPTARCVRLDTFELHCVKPGGRIYLTAGALYTPLILMNSGVEAGGNRVDSPAVGQGLSDKYNARLTANLQQGLDFGGGLEFGNVAVMQPLADRTVIYEQSAIDLEDSLWDLQVLERAALPLPLRNTFLAEVVLAVGDSCNFQVVNDVNFFGLRNPLCGGQFALDEENCDQNIFGLSIFSSPPRSVGSVSRSFLSSRPRVDISFFDTDQDFESLGIMFRTGVEVLDSLGVGQPACDDDPSVSCPSCPNLITDGTDVLRLAHSIVSPLDSFDFESFPSRTFIPEGVVDTLSSTSDNVEAGRQLRNSVNAGQHFTGTASMGSVVDNTFQVIGLEGAYVADASVIPRTSRGNLMAVVMLMGRLAGVSAIDEMAADKQTRGRAAE